MTAGRGGQHPVLQRHYRLDQSGKAGRRLGMTDIGLDRADDGWNFDPRALSRSAAIAAISIGSPTAVPVPCASNEGDAAGSNPARSIGALQGRELALDGRPGEPAAPSVEMPPAADQARTRCPRRRSVVVAHQHDEAAALARPEPVRRAHRTPASRRRQRAVAGEADELERVEAEIDAAYQRPCRPRATPAAGTHAATASSDEAQAPSTV